MMTESEWLACEDARALVEYLQQGGSERKMRLLGCAAARLLPPRDEPGATRRRAAAIRSAERFADGEASEEELALHWQRSWTVAAPKGFNAALGVNDNMLRE